MSVTPVEPVHCKVTCLVQPLQVNIGDMAPAEEEELTAQC